jgi:hypothetical protein
MLRKRIVEFLGLESVIHWLGTRINRDNVNATATVVLALATIALSAIAVLQWRTLEKTDTTLRLQQRAFLAALSLGTPDNFKSGGKVDYTEIPILTENVGKEPATKTNEFLFTAALPIPSFRNRDAVEHLIQDHMMNGATCKSLPVNPDGRAIYPGRTGDVVGLTKEDTALALARSHFAMVAGCLIYETLKERHYSEVCAVLEPLKDGSWRSINCITHNGAD